MGMRGSHFAASAIDPDFRLEIMKGLDPMIGLLDVTSQDVCRISLNSVDSACPATVENRRSTEESTDGTRYDPSLTLVTRRSGKCMEIHIEDNARSVSPDTIDMIVMPPAVPPSEAGNDGITDTLDHGRELIT
ncbi:MAG: hypothetical protein OXU19_19300 [bacterium]|nr:hypothetical protein [bacterium]MDE0241575.1 hypothetical protein [bacterium]